jgi:AcrR family transcriptional regulator
VGRLPDLADDSSEPGTAQLAEGLRERKKRLTRQLLSETATVMFLEHGFDGFKITDIAAACGVSEKTVYNYFPTKESLILDREEDVTAAIRQALGSDGDQRSPVDAIVDVLASERLQLQRGLDDLGGAKAGLALFRRFMAMVDETPSLRAAGGEMADRLARVAAVSMAERAGVDPDDPEPTIAGRALIGLWDVQRQALRRDVASDTSVADVYARAGEEVRRAAQLIDTGLWSFSVMVSGGSREQVRAAAETAQHAGRQVASALRQARKLWAAMQSQAGDDDAVGVSTWPETWGDRGSGHRPGDVGSREERQRWREVQREQVQRWKESQREQAQQWREAARALQEERREAQRRMKQELKDAHHVHQDAIRQRRTSATDTGD